MKVSIRTILLAMILPMVVSGCAIMNSVSLTPIPPNRSKVVKAEVSKTVFLAFNFNNDFIDPLVAELKAQCPGGVVQGILTKDETIAYVLVFTRRVTATGFCNMQAARSGGSSRGVSSESKVQ